MAVVRRDLSHPLVPTLAAAAMGVAYLIASPETADMAAHTYRTWLWHQVGFATWNAQWYGGHHMAGYSLLYPPLAAVAGTRLVGVVAAVVAVGLFAMLARRMAPTQTAGALAAWLFLGGVMSNVVIGRMPFTLGIALAVGAWACARRSRLAAAVLSLASVWASPVAGVFLCVAAVAMLAGARLQADTPREPADWRTALALGGPAVVGGLTMTILFPEGGSDHFVGTAFWPMLLVCLGALALVDPTRRTAIWAAGIYVAILVAAFAIPNSLGQNALRPGVVLGPALLVLFARPRAPRAAIVVIAVALLYLQWLPAVRAVEEARGDPSTHAAFHDEVLRFLQTRARPGERLEVPLTRNHWEATYLAQDYPLARGWHRQLDRKVNPLFYDSKHPLTAAAYERWLRENAVRWVALPNAPLDFSAETERKLLLEGLPFLKPVHESADWRIWEVLDTEPPVSGAAHLTAAGADGFDLEATKPGPVIVRQHMTPYWTVADGDGCVSKDDDSGWTRVDVRRAGMVRVRARFSASAVLRREPRCADIGGGPGDPRRTSAVSPPVGNR
jgi:hypothetical protein